MKLSKAISWVQNVELIIAAVLFLLCLAGFPFGIKTFAVLSGSMEPAILTGSLAYVDTGVECNEIAEGDVVAFDIGDNKVVTHRVVENDVDGQIMITKGDANVDVDLAPVTYADYIGETVFSIPYLGFLLMAFKSYWAWILWAVVSFNVILCVISHLSSQKQPSIKKEGNHHE